MTSSSILWWKGRGCVSGIFFVKKFGNFVFFFRALFSNNIFLIWQYATNSTIMEKLFFFCALFFVLFLTSCEKERAVCKSGCEPMDPNCVKPLNVKLNDEDHVTIETWVWLAREKVPKHFDVGASVTSDENFHAIEKYLKNLISEDNYIHAFTLFIDKMISDEDGIGLDNLVGFCFYTIENNKMYQKLFTKDKTGFVLNQKFGGEVQSLDYTSLSFYVNQVFEDCNDCSYILVRNANHKKPSLKKPKNEVLKKIRFFELTQKVRGSLYNRTTDPPSSTCSSPPCPYPEPFAFCDDEEGWPFPQPRCRPGSCIKESAYAKANKSQESIDADFPLSYRFRDSFLIKSDFGRKYIDFYYYLGEVIQVGDLTLDAALDLIEVFYDSRESIEIVLSPGADTSTFILIDSNLRSSSIAVLDDLRNITTDSLLLHVLDSVESHIRLYAGQEAADVLKDCCDY